MTKKIHQKVSSILASIYDSCTDSSGITYQEILNILGFRAFGLTVTFFAIPTLLPLTALPGISIFLSAPIVVFAIEILIGRKNIWLPKSLSQRKVSKAQVFHMVDKVSPLLKKIERLTKPRLELVCSPPFDRINALIILCLALLLMLPIPFSNLIFGFILILFGIAIFERDGLLIIFAYLLTFSYNFFLFSVILKGFNHFFSS